MIDISTGGIYDLLPPKMRTVEKLALSAAIKKMFDILWERIETSLLTYADMKHLSNEMCDILAMSFNISAYDQAFDIETKRELVESTLRVSATKGTAEALKNVIATIHGGARLEEWFEYMGQPFHFKIQIDAFKRGIDEAGYNKLVETIDAYKTAEAILEAIIINLKSENKIFTGAVTVCGDSAVILPEIITKVHSESRLYSGAALLLGDAALVMPEIVQQVKCDCNVVIGAVTLCGDRTIIKPV